MNKISAAQGLSQDAHDVPRESWQDDAKDGLIHCPFIPSPASGGKLYVRLVVVGVPAGAVTKCKGLVVAILDANRVAWVGGEEKGGWRGGLGGDH